MTCIYNMFTFEFNTRPLMAEWRRARERCHSTVGPVDPSIFLGSSPHNFLWRVS